MTLQGPNGADFHASGAGLVYRDSLYATDGTSGTNAAGGKMWMPIWSGEVIHAYDQYNKFEGMVDSRTISSGTTMEFPVTGTVSLNPAWGAGEELIGGENSTATTFSVKLDKRPMAAHFELDNIDLMVTQWEYRSELARQAGMTLANARDRQLGAYIARATAEERLSVDHLVAPKAPFVGTTGTTPGHEYQHLGDGDGDADENTAALTLLKDIENWMVYLQQNDIPTEGVYCAVDAASFASVRGLGVARISTDLGGAATSATEPMFAGIAQRGDLGYSLANRPYLEETLEYMGCTICKTNHGPFESYGTGNNIGEDRYNLVFTGGAGSSPAHDGACKAIMWQRGAVASLSLQGLKVDTVDDIRRNTNFTVASMMKGTGVLRPECAVCCIDGSGDLDPATTREHLRSAWGMTAEYHHALA